LEILDLPPGSERPHREVTVRLVPGRVLDLQFQAIDTPLF
jgi:hypothetical protein